ncbi:prepilin-type N-terminal cleavage/methylation domain-containing protein [Neobacillus sp. FSL H8-0543]|uniref:prepilin-type N-terminal cleavage/methylation domain-containing protein n=1 Tax=Neobacillus sp. FSL H8-0543 TaxID=2954672 RepID=UPI003159602D
MKEKQGGLTLVEVLATLTILSTVSVIIYSVFFQGLSFSHEAISKNQMHQETNLLITNLKKIHTTARRYDILNTNSDCDITVNIKDNPTDPNLVTRTEILSHPNMCFNFEITNSVSNTIIPNKTGHNVAIKLNTSDKNNKQNEITIDTFLYRVKGADYQ